MHVQKWLVSSVMCFLIHINRVCCSVDGLNTFWQMAVVLESAQYKLVI